jgi:threonine/homoserine/homoserine lactone efflux protein
LIDALTAARTPLALFGGGFMLWLAWQTARAPVTERAASTPPAAELWRCFAGTFALTLANPATIFSFIAVFGAMAGRLETASPLTMISGVLVGSALWWLLLTTLVSRFRERFDLRWRRRVNWASAGLLAGFAVWQWVGLVG